MQQQRRRLAAATHRRSLRRRHAACCLQLSMPHHQLKHAHWCACQAAAVGKHFAPELELYVLGQPCWRQQRW